jgi:hypothetical protein
VVKSNINNYGYLGCRKQIEGAIELDKEEEYVGEGFRIARI